MTPEQYRKGAAVWYEPSPGVRFRGRLVDDAPRKLGSEWVTTVTMDSPAYGVWRRDRAGGFVLGGPRMSVPAAALFALHVEDE